MAEDRIVALLEEIRDLQKLHVENYKDALKNQQESIALQQQAVKRQRTSVILLLVILGGFLLLLVAWPSLTAGSRPRDRVIPEHYTN